MILKRARFFLFFFFFCSWNPIKLPSIRRGRRKNVGQSGFSRATSHRSRFLLRFRYTRLFSKRAANSHCLSNIAAASKNIHTAKISGLLAIDWWPSVCIDDDGWSRRESVKRFVNVFCWRILCRGNVFSSDYNFSRLKIWFESVKQWLNCLYIQKCVYTKYTKMYT